MINLICDIILASVYRIAF